jgi:hypothetical protein
MLDAFIAGGFGMYPTLLAGLGLLAACLRYARRPEAHHVPLMLCLGLFTLMAGALGFVTGVMAMLRGFGTSAGDVRPEVLLSLGLQESLHNIALALLLVTLSVLAASVGAWRLSHRVSPPMPA